ncbi:MAG: hypothetical protein KY391_04935 [Actinobacteria bacterium]|nr:hypothetical protein [Actinomycetota bacterium]
MKAARITRFVAVLAAVALVGGVFVAPATAGKKKKCGQFTPGVEAAAEGEVVTITKKATEAKPVVIEYEHGPAGPSNPFDGSHLLNEEKFFNIQVNGPASGLYILQEFSDFHDLDLYLLDGGGGEVASSGAFNPTPVGPFSSGGNGGTNYESISGYPVATCEGFTIRSNAYLTPGTDATLTIWLGTAVAPE